MTAARRALALVAGLGTLLATAAIQPAVASNRLPEAVSALLEEARGACAGFENGALDVPEDAARQVDLTGDGRGWVVDFGRLSCSTMASFSCGSGGCRTAFVVGDRVTEELTHGWTAVDMTPYRVIVLQLHGSRCGGIGPTPCFKAMAWDGETHSFTDIAPPRR